MKKPTQTPAATAAAKPTRVEKILTAPFTVLSLKDTVNKEGGKTVRANCPYLGTLSGYFSGESIKTLCLTPNAKVTLDIYRMSNGEAEIAAPRITADDIIARAKAEEERLAKLARKRK